MHAPRAGLQQAISEASSGRANIETNFSGDIDFPVIQCAFQLQSAAADVLQIFAEQSNTLQHRLRAGLLDFLLSDQNFAREDQRLPAFPRRNQAAFE